MYRLYGRKGSGSVAPQMILEELGLPHEVVWVSREEAQQPAYRKIHPQGRVLEQALHPRLLGEALTGADLYLCMLFAWHDSPEDLARRFPKLGRLAQEVAARPAVAKVMKANRS